MRESLKKYKGITLIALVVTIIVLLILAGISITMLTGQNGILNRAGEAKTTNGVAQGEELIKVSVMDALTRGAGELTDENLKKALSSNLGTEGKDYEIVGSEDCGWTVTIKENEKDYKISSTGKIGEIEKVEGSSSEWEVKDNAVVKYLGISDDIVVPNYVNGVKITEIGAGIFQNSKKTGTLKISDGIKVIDENAFNGSKFTGELVLPNTISEIKENAFLGCSGFEGTLSIPGTVKEISKMAFVSCSGFNKLILNMGIEKIDGYVFASCSGFKGDLEIPKTIETIGEFAFVSCNGFDGNLILNEGLKIVSPSAFNQCSGLKGSLIIPSSVNEIGSAAFYGCSGLEGDLIIPDNVKVDSAAFTNIKIAGTIYIGKNIENMEFSSNLNATKVIMNSLIKDYSGMNRFPYMKSCWLSSDIIKDINTVNMFSAKDCIREDVIIYTDATEDDPNWPKEYNPYGLTFKYNVSLDEYRKLTD